jgi:hypothetical protein
MYTTFTIMAIMATDETDAITPPFSIDLGLGCIQHLRDALGLIERVAQLGRTEYALLAVL